MADDLKHALDRLRGIGIERVIAVDLSRHGFPVSVVRMIVPGLEGPTESEWYRAGTQAESKAMMDAVIFLGPTLPVETARGYLDAVYCPPVKQGDILDVLPKKSRLIGIIDGYFETVPAVWHKETLYAMSRGVHVYGASSMGALRAAELEAFGMVGIGQIFDWYRSGMLEDDDEVAVSHGPADAGYLPLSEAIVNIRYAIDASVRGGVLSAELGSRFVSIAKTLHYSERDFRRVLDIMKPELEPREANQLRQFLDEHRPRVKEADALMLLQRAASFLALDPPPIQISYSVERTVFLDAMINEAERDAAAAEARRSTIDPEEQFKAGLLRHEVLLRLLARREATRLGLECSNEEVCEAAGALLEHRGSHPDSHFSAKGDGCGVTIDR